MNADGSQLFLGDAAARRGPHARAPRHAPGAYRVLARDPDQGFFQQAHIVDHAQPCAALGPMRPQVEDRIADQLTRSVIGHIAAALDDVQSRAAPIQFGIGREDKLTPGISAQRQHRRVLQQQQHVADSVRAPQLYQLLLKPQRPRILHPAQV